MPREWKALLEPWATRYMELTEALADHCERLSDDELVSLERATYSPTTTNCWWATYNVAPLVRQAVQREQYRRRRRAGTLAEEATS